MTGAQGWAVLRLGLLLAGSGQIVYTSSDAKRLEAALLNCSIRAEYRRADPDRGCELRLGWSACQQLAGQLATAGGLLLAGGAPAAIASMKRKDGQGPRRPGEGEGEP